jgi:hypothetical protein
MGLFLLRSAIKEFEKCLTTNINSLPEETSELVALFR